MAASTKITTLMSDHERYTTTFAEYCKRSRKYDVLRDWINSDFPEKIVNTISAKATDEIMMLGVGSGSGLVETYALKQLLTKWSKVTHTVVEPNLDHIDQFKDLATREKDSLKGVTFNWKQQTLEQFRQETSGQTRKYHLMMVVQILYYIDDVEDFLKYLTNMLTEGGIMVIVMVAENNCLARIAQKFPQFENTFQHAIYTKHIEQMLARNNIKFRTDEITTSIDSTGCFDKDSKEGELLIDFITQVPYLKKQTTESFYNEVVEYIKSDEVSLPKSDDGRTWLRCNYDAIFVTK